MNKLVLRNQLQTFLEEDIRDGDITSSSIFSENQIGHGNFIVKDNGILSGIDIITETYNPLDASINTVLHKKDGDMLKSGDMIATVTGPVGSLLTGERVILNLLQRMSGIATLTNKAVTSLNSEHTKICDTRKTTPGLRMLEKYAVTCGGGFNHRFGLYDGVMIKDNHIAFCGSIKKAVTSVREKLGHMVKIEVETENKDQVLEAVEAGVDVIMLDNRSPEEVSELVNLIPDTIVSEASGNINLATISQYGHCGVDYVSLGFLTHSVKALDISFDVQFKGENK